MWCVVNAFLPRLSGCSEGLACVAGAMGVALDDGWLAGLP